MKELVIPDDVKVPAVSDLYLDGRWKYVPALARSIRWVKGGYKFKQALLIVQEPVNLQQARFETAPGASETYQQFVGSTYTLRLCVYSRITGHHKWLPPEQALQQLGLICVAPSVAGEDSDAALISTSCAAAPQQPPGPRTSMQQSVQPPAVSGHHHSVPVAAAGRYAALGGASMPLQQAAGAAGSGLQQAQASSGWVPATSQPLVCSGPAEAVGVVDPAAGTQLSSVRLYVPVDNVEAVYRPVRELGRGGLAVAVQLERQQPHPTLPTQAVLKLLHVRTPLMITREAVNNFKLAPHPNMVHFYTVWQGDASWCPGAINPGFGILMEYCPHGTSLDYFNQQLEGFKANIATRRAAPSSSSSSSSDGDGAAATSIQSAEAGQQAYSKMTLAEKVQAHLAIQAHGADVALLDSACTSAKEAAMAVLQQGNHSWDTEGYLAAAADAPWRVFALDKPVRTHMNRLLRYMTHLHFNGNATRGEAIGIHHDIKPENILIGSDGDPKLADWGMARIMSLTHTTEMLPVVGATPRYAAPEKLTGVKDPATNFALSDVWSIMLSWLELLTGLPPFFWMLDAQRDLHRLFREPDAQTRLEQMLDTYYTPLLPSDILAFFKWALKVDESVRPGLVDIGRHEYTCRNILSRE